MKRPLSVVLLSVLVLCPAYPAVCSAKPADDVEESLDFAGRTRIYQIHIPPQYRKDQPVPLVLVLHGGGGNAANAARMSGMSEKADAEGFLAVYPNGTGFLSDRLLTWNSGNCCGYAFQHQADDVGFIRALLDDVERKYSIDPKRVYATGISNGGMMSYRLACELSDRIAAIAPVAGALNVEDPHPKEAVSVIIFHGTADEHVLYMGGAPRKTMDRVQRVDKPVSYAVSFWVRHDECSPAPRREEHGNIVCETYSGGRAGTEVVLYTVKGGGHAWPGGEPGRRFGNVDLPTREISATDLMWDFFKRHPKNG